MAVYLAPAEFTGSGHPVVMAKAAELCASTGSRRDAARAVFYFVRDLRYEGGDFEDLEICRASSVLAAGHGYCAGKAALCTALARAAGIPARPGFADVRNHLASPRLLAATGTDVFAWRGYSQLFLKAARPVPRRPSSVPGRRDAEAVPVRGRSRHHPVPSRQQGRSRMTQPPAAMRARSACPAMTGGDALALPPGPATMDASWLPAVIHHLDLPAAARELARVLRPVLNKAAP